MTLQEIKEKVETDTYKGEPIIFVTGGSNFIPEQYIKQIAKNLKRRIHFYDNIESLISNKVDIFSNDVDDNELKVLVCPDLNSTNKKLLTSSFVIIITDTIKDGATKEVFQDLIVEVPKLEAWQIKAFLFTQCEGIDQRNLEKLFDLCGGNTYRVDQEAAKISIFTKPERKFVFDEFVENGIFDDLCTSTVFNLVSAITSRDLKKLSMLYQDMDNMDINEYGFVTILYNNFRNIISIQLGINPTPEKLGLSQKQFNAISYSCGKYSSAQLKEIFEFLSYIDYRIKTGQLPTDILVDYIIQKIFSI